jgi:HSP20 family molecular chaperone IbpA
MHFDNDKFPFGNQQFSSESINKIKEMANQMNSLLNDDFLENIYGRTRSRHRNNRNNVPIEIWENNEELFLLLVLPGLETKNSYKIHFKSEEELVFQAKTEALQPPSGKMLMTSELPHHGVKSHITLPSPVKTENFTSYYENGVLTFVFKKHDKSFISVDF